MSIPQQLEKLASLQRDGILTDEEFEVAKQRVITEGSVANEVGDSSAHLEEIKRQNELARIDREWEMERKEYQVRGRYGARYTPSKAGSVGTGILFACFGVFWMAFTSSFPRGPGLFELFPLFGLLPVFAGVHYAVVGYQKASHHERAQQRYRRRRRALLEETEREPRV